MGLAQHERMMTKKLQFWVNQPPIIKCQTVIEGKTFKHTHTSTHELFM